MISFHSSCKIHFLTKPAARCFAGNVGVFIINDEIGQVGRPRFDVTQRSAVMAEKVVPTRDSFGRLQDGTEISR